MPEVLGDYVQVLLQILRADFFGTVPNYKENLLIEKARMEADHPTWASNVGLQQMLANARAGQKFGKKKGSPFQEV